MCVGVDPDLFRLAIDPLSLSFCMQVLLDTILVDKQHAKEKTTSYTTAIGRKEVSPS